MQTIVVGAGLLGLTTAYFLRQAGADVLVIERQPGPGLETSYANGGMLHASQASPWNEPGVLGMALRMLGREDSALLIRPHALPRMLSWAWAFFRHSAPARYLVNVEKNARLAGYSLQVLARHLAPLALDFERADRGTLKIYREPAALAVATRIAERCRAWDLRFDVLGPTEVAALEPALAPISARLSGAIHFPDDVAGDAHRFCVALQARAAADGVRFEFGRSVETVLTAQGRVSGLRVDGETHAATCVVLAAASYTPALARSAGVRVPVQPVKGYSLTLPMAAFTPAPAVPVIDEHFHAAVCPLGARLRVAGTAEFAGFDARLTPARIANLFELVRQVYPDGAARLDRAEAREWCGFRPMSPDGVGIMGETPVPGLFLNTGHGHLGWTMAPGAGKLVADRVLGRRTDIDIADYSLARF